MNHKYWVSIMALIALLGAVSAYYLSSPPSSSAVPTYTYRVIETYPHDSEAFTQGLVFADGKLYEGTGMRGQSSLRRVDLETGNVENICELPENCFGEGITVFGDKIIQLTWTSGLGFVYDCDSFEKLQEFNYPTEGWGITHDGERLIMSDGSENLYFLDPESFAEVSRIAVRDNLGNPVIRLNELEYVKGEVYANIWQTDRVAIISPQTGKVTGWIELEGLLTPQEAASADVLNGIAYDTASDRLFVTGKYWPKLFEIELVPSD